MASHLCWDSGGFSKWCQEWIPWHYIGTISNTDTGPLWQRNQWDCCWCTLTEPQKCDIVRYRCSCSNHLARDCLQGCAEETTDQPQRRMWGFWCNKGRQIISECQGNTLEAVCINFLPKELKNVILPTTDRMLNGRKCTTLIDIGCIQTLINRLMCLSWRPREVNILRSDRKTLKCSEWEKSSWA